jgi:tetratricopeptide (TPR) repeat protein
LRSIAVGLAFLWCLGTNGARADEAETQAKISYQKAMAAFGLGDYAEAAEHYETAFRLKPDGALLYNAAQAHRLAGNKKRALELYRNFVRLYGGKSPLAADARKRIGELERTLADSSAVSPPASVPAAPPPGPGAQPKGPPLAATETAIAAPASSPPALAAIPEPSSGMAPGMTPAPAAPPPPPAAASSSPLDAREPAPSSVTLVGPATPPPAPRRSLLASPWFWAGAALVLAAGAAALLVALNPSYPQATFGHADLGK